MTNLLTTAITAIVTSITLMWGAGAFASDKIDLFGPPAEPKKVEQPAPEKPIDPLEVSDRLILTAERAEQQAKRVIRLLGQ